jgi:hypothetical protein
MTTRRWMVALLIASLLMVACGCHGAGTRYRSVPEPSLAGALELDDPAIAAAPPRMVSFVDRHPMLSKPREYWETSGDNTIVKAVAATFIGVPVGLFGELRQIVEGVPPEVRR